MSAVVHVRLKFGRRPPESPTSPIANLQTPIETSALAMKARSEGLGIRASESIRWFTDGERRDGKELWKLASVYIKSSELPISYQYRKVWREGLEVAMKVKGSQGKPHIEWLKQEHPFTAISPKSDVHANHNEAQNSSLRRRASGDRRRQNLYAKAVEGLQRVLNMQRIIHNWVRPHWGLGKTETPAMAMG
jgi:hypothetical protein